MRTRKSLLLAIGVILLAFRTAGAQSVYGEYVESDFVLPSNSFVQPDPLATCCPIRPKAWVGTFDFDLLILRRSRVDSLDLVSVGGVDVLDARDLDFDESFAFRVTATLPSDCGCDLQISYLTSHDFRDSAEFTGAVQDVFFDLVGNVTELDLQYESNLDSLEFNIRSRQWKTVAPIAGLRFLQIDETAEQIDVTNSLQFTGNVDNELYGFQLGADVLLGQWGPVRLESTIKGGVYYNDVNLLGDTATVDLNRSFSHIAFVGEVGIAGVWQLGPRHAVRIGYQSMLFDGVAMLFDQYDNFSITTGQGSLDLGRTSYLGGFISFEATW